MNNDLPHTSERILNAGLQGLSKWGNEQISIDDYLDQHVNSELRPPVSSLLFEYFRNKVLIDNIIASKCKRSPKPRCQRLLALSLTQCFFQSGIRPESAANVAVAVARQKYGKPTSGFINGVLRNILRDGLEKYEKETADSPLAAFPDIIRKRWHKCFNQEEISDLDKAITEETSLIFRLTGKLRKEELEAINAVKLPEFPWAPDMKFFSCNSKELFKHNFLSEGKIYIQDPATALAPCMVEINGGERILDMCAAPGGKTLILAERLKGSGKIVAADRSAKRQKLTRQNFVCRKLDCEIIIAGAEKLKLPGESFEIILADVPCTNTGVFRHKPDALWRFSEESLADTVKLQRGILDKAAELIAPGGKIIYCTCSIEQEENRLQAEKFIADNPGFELIKHKLLLPNTSHDGAFAAVISKKK